MTTYTPANIRARKIALWVCSIVGLMFVIALATKAAISLYFFNARNQVAIVVALMLFTGVMHALRKDLRIPAIALSVVSIAALFLLFFSGVHS